MKKNKGFTIPEVLVAMFVISMGLVGVSSLMIQNYQSQYTNKNTLIASQLAQEGLELVRWRRDTNWSGPNWKSGIGNGNYIIDYSSNIASVDSIADARLYINNNGFYSHDVTSTQSIFFRLITISDETEDSIKVSCKVEWENRGKKQSYMADTILYDWK